MGLNSKTRFFTGLLLTLCTVMTMLVPAMAQDAPLVRVDLVRVEPLSQTAAVIGRLVARQAGEVSARINGPIESFDVEVGDRVDAGQVLATLTNSYLLAQRDLAAGELAVAQANLKTRKARVTLAKQTLARLERLKKSAAFNQSRYEDAKQEVVIAQAEVTQAEATILSRIADTRSADINLSYATITAPYSGVVTRRMTEAGAYVQTGQAVVQMVADRSLEIEADVPFRFIGGLQIGTKVRVALDDSTTEEARVRAVIPSENPLTRTRAVRFTANFDHSESPLADEQSVTIYVPVGAQRDVLTVHKDAIIKRPNGAIVYVADSDTAKLQPVELGLAVGNRLVVESGLQEGQKVVVRGNERLRPGQSIIVDGAS
ncbi:efflux RND transporter periplasmic adaptor subunit [Denitrobaculum tricleocarpae]|uniref:Efflux RND transporter periplasmic adaptor subunit n=1 Tax=Denitrobaculum tricleocarpae TaxID=2591009 RepID=A0A545TXN5_9PROT|nr:efflux RND transporter periplasmic adaptor subunit [Denitrobaculum tricleocarpae]